MQAVFIVSPDKKSEAERIAKNDDVVSRQSITMRSSSSLGLEKEFENCYFLVIEGSEEALERAKNILGEICTMPEKPELILEKIKEDEEKAVQGFGGILG